MCFENPSMRSLVGYRFRNSEKEEIFSDIPMHLVLQKTIKLKILKN